MIPSLPYPMALLLPALAVLLSYLVLFAVPSVRIKDHRLLLSFSGAFLLGVTLFELLPDVFARHGGEQTGVFIALGILLQIILESFSRGAEHGHLHGSPKGSGFPLMLFVSLGLHAFLEGIPLSSNQPAIWGITIHKIPVALILGGFFIESGMSRTTTWIFMGAFAMMTPVGTWMGALPALHDAYDYLLALVIGMILHVSTIILFESSRNHAHNIRKLAVILLGLVLAYLL
ncbi:MAG: ZIP family metal transporter [Robiginitalea sp.]